MTDINNQKKHTGSKLAICIALGVAFGAAFGNVAMGLIIGLVFGVVLDAQKQKQDSDKK